LYAFNQRKKSHTFVAPHSVHLQYLVKVTGECYGMVYSSKLLMTTGWDMCYDTMACYYRKATGKKIRRKMALCWMI